MPILPEITIETRTDSDNLSNWNTIVITRTDGVETSRVTTYDIAFQADGVTPKPTSGMIVTDERDEIGLTRRLSVDAQDVNKWSSIETLYDTSSGSSVLTSKTTIYDNGQTLVDQFNASGEVISSVRTDATVSTEAWKTITTTVDEETGLTTVLTELDDGSSTQETTDADGKMVQRVRTDATGADSTSDYSTITTDYDADGNVEQVTYVFDDGLERTETYTTAGGDTYMSGLVQTETGTEYPFDTITETLNAAGNVTSRTRTNDDGSSESQTFDAAGTVLTDTRTTSNGISELRTYDETGLVSTVTTDGSTDGEAKSWTSKITAYDDGEKVADSIVYDNGASSSKTFVDGNLATLQWNDGADGTAGDAKSYDSILTTFAPDGDRLTSVTTMDNADTISRTYNDDGSLAQHVRTDVSESRSYATITRDYDESGALEGTTLVRDSGLTTVNSFDTETGLRTSSVVTDATGTDSTKSWSEVSKTYDADGNLTQHQTTYDNGSVKTTTYSYTDGEVSSVSATQDGASTEGKIYVAAMSKTYAEDTGGELYLSELSTTLSNDKQVVKSYAADGDISSNMTTDVSADGTGFKWDTIEILHDDGGRVDSKLVTYDSGDEVLTLYDDTNAKTARVQFDGDESNIWQFRVTEYDSAGNSTTEYATAADLDSAYRDFFDLAPIAV